LICIRSFIDTLYRVIINYCPIAVGVENPYKFWMCGCAASLATVIERFNLQRENGGRGFSNLEILQHNQIASLKNYFFNRARDNTFFNALVSADKGYTPLNLSDNIISDIVKPNIPDTIANIKLKSLHGRYFKEIFTLRRRILYLQ
jgi:hypothetical protein